MVGNGWFSSPVGSGHSPFAGSRLRDANFPANVGSFPSDILFTHPCRNADYPLYIEGDWKLNKATAQVACDYDLLLINVLWQTLDEVWPLLAKYDVFICKIKPTEKRG